MNPQTANLVKNLQANSSLDVVQKMAKLCLDGEGDFARHLQSVAKVQLTHVQYPLDTFRFEITNLAVDLRDGVRLTRLAEILVSRDDCLQLLRWPANGVSQRTHNISIALGAIREAGIELRYSDGSSIDAQHIQNGDRERTLYLLWSLLGQWRLPQYLERIDLKHEIWTLKGLLKLRNQELPAMEVCLKVRVIADSIDPRTV
jgi:abnormal spindle-like microcephaly-associated protein